MSLAQKPLDRLKEWAAAVSLTESERAAFLVELKNLEKESAKQEFKVMRTLKDKEIAINLLNSSVENLEVYNRQLSAKNEEIGQKNAELYRQQQVIEASRKKLELHLQELQNAYEAHEQFSYIASHDLKTPLRSISGYAQLLQRRYSGQIGSEGEEFLGFIVSGVRHMNDIISDLLEYSRTSLKNQLKSPTDLNRVIQSVESNLEEEIKKTHATILVHPLPVLTVHEAGMVQLFQNLVSNSLKFRSQENPVIEIHAEQHRNVWQFYIHDNGIGIDSTFSHKLFQPFQRLQTDQAGLGMGLAVCRKIVRLHHGEIWVRPKQGSGATFVFTLPADVE